MYKRILIAVDGSAQADRALNEAIVIAAEVHARLRIIHIIDSESILATHGERALNPGATIAESVNAANSILNAGLERAKGHGVDAETGIHEDLRAPVSDGIVQDAKEWKADLIVLGTHGRRSFRRFALGGDAEAVARKSPVPVLLIPYSGAGGEQAVTNVNEPTVAPA